MQQLPARSTLSCHYIYRQIPNIVTSFRLVSAVLLLLLTFATDVAVKYFLALFVIAAVSDMLDGFLARRLDLCTEFGAKLDSVSDLILYLSVFVFLLVNKTHDITSCASLFAVGMLVQFSHLVFSFCKHKQFPAYHSTFSRFSAYLIFFAVVSYWTLGFSYAFSLVAIFWTASSIEGMIISHILKEPMENVSGITRAIEISRC